MNIKIILRSIFVFSMASLSFSGIAQTSSYPNVIGSEKCDKMKFHTCKNFEAALDKKGSIRSRDTACRNTSRFQGMPDFALIMKANPQLVAACTEAMTKQLEEDLADWSIKRTDAQKQSMKQKLASDIDNLKSIVDSYK